MDKMGGVLGIDPQSHSWRTLDEMYEIKRRYDWEQTAAICFTVAVYMRGPKSKQPKFEWWYPFAKLDGKATGSAAQVPLLKSIVRKKQNV